jgi:hypothetical protein
MFRPTFLDHHSHDSVLIRLSPLFMRLYHFVDLDIANKVPGNKHKITGDNSVRVNIPHCIAWGICPLGGHDRYNLDSRAWFGPFGLSSENEHIIIHDGNQDI